MEIRLEKEDLDNIIYGLVRYYKYCYITKAEQYNTKGSTRNIKQYYNHDIFRVFLLDSKSELQEVKFFDNLKEALYYYNILNTSKEHYNLIKSVDIMEVL